MRRGKRLREWRVARIMGCREGLCPFSGQWVLVDKNLLLGGSLDKNRLSHCTEIDKNRYKPRICFPSLRLATDSAKRLTRVNSRLLGILNAKQWHDVPLENTYKYGDKQNKNRWACKTVDIIRETDAVTNRTRTVGALKLCIENTYNRKQPLELANHSIRS
jgi:hypothetical protein